MSAEITRRLQSAVNRLAGVVADEPQRKLLQWAVVTAHSTGPNVVTITLRGTSIPGVKYLSSYSPTNSDTVAVLVEGNDLLVLGKPA